MRIDEEKKEKGRVGKENRRGSRLEPRNTTPETHTEITAALESLRSLLPAKGEIGIVGILFFKEDES